MVSRIEGHMLRGDGHRCLGHVLVEARWPLVMVSWEASFAWDGDVDWLCGSFQLQTPKRGFGFQMKRTGLPSASTSWVPGTVRDYSSFPYPWGTCSKTSREIQIVLNIHIYEYNVCILIQYIICGVNNALVYSFYFMYTFT